MMRLLQMLRMRMRALLRAEAVDTDLATEMQEHFEHLVEENVARGMSVEAARHAARREFGPVPQLVEQSRDARGVAWALNLFADIRYGSRQMRRAPGFAVVAILTVALGIGATTAMFSVVYGVLLQPLPFREPDRLVNLWSSAQKRGLPRAFVGMANVYDWRARNQVFEDIAALRPIANFNLLGVGEPERLNGARLSANLLPVLGVSPILGRNFTEDEDEIGHERVAILTYGLWQRRFGGDPTVIGRTISLSGVPHVVVGVMGRDFAYPTREYQIYVPHTFNPHELVDRQNYSYMAVARLEAGVTLDEARAEMERISADLEREYPKTNDGIGTLVLPMLDDTVRDVETPLVVLLAAVVAMLLIGCVNLANLLLARSMARRGELAVRAALGAGRVRLVAQSIAEVVPMLAVGGALGVMAAAWAISGLVPLLPADVPRVENIGLHVPVLVGAALALVAIGLFVGVWPALEASRGGLATAIDFSRTVAGSRRRARTRDLLVVAQLAATLWLVVGAALLLRSFNALTTVNPGFRADDVYSLHLAIARTKYPKDSDIAELCRRLLERVQAVPGVVAAGMVNRLPLGGGTQTGPLDFEGFPLVAGVGLQADLRTVTPDYFRTLEIPLLAGRGPTEADSADAPVVALIDQQIASTVYKGINPIGRRFRIAVAGAPWMEIVGVVGHIRHERVDEPGRPQVYWNYRQRTQDRVALVVKTRTDPQSIASSVVAAVRSVDPDQPVYDARPLQAVVDRALAQRWLQTTVLAAFAVIALLLASIGVYGVSAYAVGERRREFGIRLALGAHRREIVAMVLRRGTLLFGGGAAIGLVASAASARLLGSLLYGVGAFDPVTVSAATLVLVAVALVACGLPARRAAGVDPTTALRIE